MAAEAHRGTKGGPNGDDVLPPLPDGVSHLSGIALVRACLSRAREGTQKATEPRRGTWRPLTRSQPATAAHSAPTWTPHDMADAMPELTPGHWVDGTPIPDDEPPPEEDW